MNKTAALQWSIFALCLGAVYVCWALWPPLVLAAWTAELARPLLVRFERRLRGRRKAATALSLLLFVVLALPLGLVVVGVVTGAQELLQILAATASPESALESIVVAGSDPAPALRVPASVPEVFELLQRYGTISFAALSGIAGATAEGLVWLLIYFGGAYAFLLNGAAIDTWMKDNSPLAPRHLERFSAAFRETGRGLLIGVGLTSATQGLAATLIYLSLGVPRWWVLGPITGLASMLPFVGSALIWAPIAIGLFLTDHPAKGAILIALGISVIGTVDNLLRPVFARLGSLQMPTFLLFVAIFGGLSAFGAWGALLGPLIVRLLMEALAIRRECQDADGDLAAS